MKSVSASVNLMLCLGFLGLGALPASAIVRLGDLGPLEIKFFAHQYDRETPTDRLARLEKLVFGTVQSGSIEERVEKISKTVDIAVPEKTDVVSSSKKLVAVGRPPVQSAESKTQDRSSVSDYPRVSELERSLLGRTYVGESVRQRLSRLETKAYGAPSRVDDLAIRVDKLTSYAGVYGMQSADSGAINSDSLHGLAGIDAVTQPRSTGMLEKVSAMEVKLFGHANSSQPLTRRINELETNMLGSASSNSKDDMTTRVNYLWANGKRQSSDLSAQVQAPRALQPFPSSTADGQSGGSYGASSLTLPVNATAYPVTPSSFPYGSTPFMASNGASNSQYAGAQSKHKHKGQHGSFLGKIGKVVAFAGTAAVGASGLAVGAMGSMNTGYYGMGMGSGFGSPYSYAARSSFPSYGSVSSIGSFGNLNTGSMFGSSLNSNYAGSFFSP